MNKLFALYGSSSGRLSRRGWWFGILWLAIAYTILTLVPLIAFGGSMWSSLETLAEPNGGAALGSLLGSLYWGYLALQAIFGYPLYCLCAKRRHDRGRSGLDVFLYLLPQGGITLLLAWGLGYVPVEIGPGVTFPVTTNWLASILPLQQLFLLYLVIVLGFLQGSPRANAFGAVPSDRIATITAPTS